MRVKILKWNYKDATSWDKYVMSHSRSEVYHLCSWKKILEKMSLKTIYLYVEKNNNIIGVLPLAFSSSITFGKFLTSIPFYNYSGILADTNEAAMLLYQKAQKVALEYNATHIELRHTYPVLENVPQKEDKVRMLLPLAQNGKEMWQQLKSKVRSQIRRAKKENMVVKIGRQELINDFYRVFSINMRDLGTPVWTKKLFRYVFQCFPKQSHICCVYHNNTPVASGFLLGFRNTLEIPSASSLRKYNPLSPNMLLYWHALEFACDNEYQQFDFGRSSKESGSYRFKKQWGATPHPLYWQYWLKNEEMPKINPQNTKYQMAIKIWQKLPVRIANIIGPMISSNLP